MTLLHEVRFPGESDEYRRARNELLQAEIDLRRQIEAVAAQRRTLPLGGAVPSDYEFDEWDEGANTARPVRLSELFGPQRTVRSSFPVVRRDSRSSCAERASASG